jgi:ferritin-like metal-binding protein YciE
LTSVTSFILQALAESHLLETTNSSAEKRRVGKLTTRKLATKNSHLDNQRRALARPQNILQDGRDLMSLRDVLVDELRDLYSAENQLVKALPKMAKGSTNHDLKTLFTEHLEETKGQVERLKRAFVQLEEKPTGEFCKGMEGLVAEGKEQLEKDEEGALKDVAIVGAALRVEHYEIAGYTAAIAIARQLGEDEVVALLTETLTEEQKASEKVLGQAEPLFEEASADTEDDTVAAPKRRKKAATSKR